MKKIIALIAFLLVISAPHYCYADEYDEQLSSYDLSAFESLDDSAKGFLEELEIDDFNFEKISEISITDIFKYIYQIAVEKADGPIRTCIIVVAFVLLSAFFKSFSAQLSRNSINDFMSTAINLLLTVFITTRITNCIGLCCSTVKLCSDFTYAFFPTFCIIVATTGGAMTSFSVNTTLLILSQSLNIISNIFFIPITNCFLALSMCSSLRQELNLGGVVTTVRSLITTSISTLSAIFVSILSLKTAVASRADALGLRSVRFAINSVVPVIGSSISEGLLSIQSYSSLIKTSVGVVGIIAVFAIFLPSIIEVVLWRFTLSVSSLCAQVFSDNGAFAVIKAFKDTLLIINVILILSMVTTIISIGILVAAKTAV